MGEILARSHFGPLTSESWPLNRIDSAVTNRGLTWRKELYQGNGRFWTGQENWGHCFCLIKTRIYGDMESLLPWSCLVVLERKLYRFIMILWQLNAHPTPAFSRKQLQINCTRVTGRLIHLRMRNVTTESKLHHKRDPPPQKQSRIFLSALGYG